MGSSPSQRTRKRHGNPGERARVVEPVGDLQRVPEQRDAEDERRLEEVPSDTTNAEPSQPERPRSPARPSAGSRPRSYVSLVYQSGLAQVNTIFCADSTSSLGRPLA